MRQILLIPLLLLMACGSAPATTTNNTASTQTDTTILSAKELIELDSTLYQTLIEFRNSDIADGVEFRLNTSQNLCSIVAVLKNNLAKNPKDSLVGAIFGKINLIDATWIVGNGDGSQIIMTKEMIHDDSYTSIIIQLDPKTKICKGIIVVYPNNWIEPYSINFFKNSLAQDPDQDPLTIMPERLETDENVKAAFYNPKTLDQFLANKCAIFTAISDCAELSVDDRMQYSLLYLEEFQRQYGELKKMK